MNMKERMLAGLPYKAWLDGLSEERTACKVLCHKYNQISPDKYDELEELAKKILGSCGKKVYIEQPIKFDYGKNIHVGENFFSNYNFTVLDVAKVTIGDNCFIAPNVAIYTAGHPLHHESRNTGYEYGIPITIGDNVWIGGNVVICPGVTIGDGVVIGAGSVVTKDIPDYSLAAGNPFKVIRKITEDDREYYYKDRKFDVEII